MCVFSAFRGPEQNPQYLESEEEYSGIAKKFESGDEDNYSQVTDFWNKVSFTLSSCTV